MMTEAQLSAFHQVALNVYRDDPLWLPEDPAALERQFALAEDNPDLAVWSGTEGDSARLAAFFSPKQLIDGVPTAFFGFWEGVDDIAAHQSLFEQACDWAREQGAQQVLGPINISTFNAYRVRLNYFEEGGFPGEPYNPHYYPDLLESLGFTEAKRFHSWLGPMQGRADAMGQTLEPAYQALLGDGLQFTRLTAETWLERLDEFYSYVDQIFGNNYAYTGISAEGFRAGFGEPIARKLCPNTSVLVEDGGGAVAGFFLAFPDYAPLARQGNPERKGLGDVSYDDLQGLTARRTILGKTGGVHPDYRQKGLFGVMSYCMMAAATPYYDWTGAVLVREDNPSARVGRLAFSGPQDQQRDYALYVKNL